MRIIGTKGWKKVALAVMIGAGAASALYGDTIVATYETAGTQSANTTTLCKNATTCWIGQQTFTPNRTLANANFTTIANIGAADGKITGTYSSGLVITKAGQYGGAGGSGYYADVNNSSARTNYSLTLNTDDLDGVNYFGLWFSALDAGNELQFYEKGNLVYSFTPEMFIGLVGDCPSSSDAFCGNPNSKYSGQDSNEQYAFLNFFDAGGYFDKIVFSETSSGGRSAGFESDNHTVGCIDPGSGTVIGAAPEPGSLVLLGTGLLALAGLRRRFALKRTD